MLSIGVAPGVVVYALKGALSLQMEGLTLHPRLFEELMRRWRWLTQAGEEAGEPRELQVHQRLRSSEFCFK